MSLIARFMGPTWGPSGADRAHVGPMNLLSGVLKYSVYDTSVSGINKVTDADISTVSLFLGSIISQGNRVIMTDRSILKYI